MIICNVPLRAYILPSLVEPSKLTVSQLRSFASGQRRHRFSSSSHILSSAATGTVASSIPDFLSNSFLTIPRSAYISSKSQSSSAADGSIISTPTPVPTPITVFPLAQDTHVDRPPVQDFAAKAFSCTDAQTVRPAARSISKSKSKAASVLDPYIALTKPRLTALIVLSTMTSYALAPCEASLSPLLFLTLGTTLTSGAANAINMGREHVFDGLMTRTQSRPVVRGLITPNDAFTFAGVTGSLGVAALYFGVNPTVAVLGAANIALYSGLYTTLKRKSILNTWVGALVGTVPPLMGWAASSSLADPGAWCLAALLYAWQFPHFNALSHNIREEYRRAGYVMTAWTNPALNSRVALRHAIAMFPICVGLSYFGVTDWVFAFDSSIVNGWLTYVAYKFWAEQRNQKQIATHTGKELVKSSSPYSQGSSSSSSSSARSNGFARSLFWGSVIHLPAILVLAMIHKKGQWDWLLGPSDGEELE